MPPKTKAPQAISTDECYQILDRAQQLIASGWVRSTEAVDINGKSCVPWDERAAKWCIVGAVRAITHYMDNDQAAHNYCVSIINVANANVLHAGSAPAVNDPPGTTQEQVIRVFENAKAWVAQYG